VRVGQRRVALFSTAVLQRPLCSTTLVRAKPFIQESSLCKQANLPQVRRVCASTDWQRPLQAGLAAPSCSLLAASHRDGRSSAQWSSRDVDCCVLRCLAPRMRSCERLRDKASRVQ